MIGVGRRGEKRRGVCSDSVGINLPKVKVEVNAAERSWSVSGEDAERKTGISWMISARSSGVLSVNVGGEGGGGCVKVASSPSYQHNRIRLKACSV